eukprot:TRINITY_DN42881_c0_g1_i1.p2 TRINITY_DN42881_c0_g1~~TRINITY_DN42881_c0_g1_i1.p2  ORF type:complete len:132 (-),score=22.44 TRINITY_DN42881_c0_g1_i1:238-633(-)
MSLQTLQLLPELGNNPFIPRLFKMFDSDGDGKIDVQEFTAAIEHFATLKTLDDKYQFAFQVYDVDGDGGISHEDLYQTLEHLVGPNLGQNQLEEIVNCTMEQYDKDADGFLSLEEFKTVLSVTDLENKLLY